MQFSGKHCKPEKGKRSKNPKIQNLSNPTKLGNKVQKHTKKEEGNFTVWGVLNTRPRIISSVSYFPRFFLSSQTQKSTVKTHFSATNKTNQIYKTRKKPAGFHSLLTRKHSCKELGFSLQKFSIWGFKF